MKYFIASLFLFSIVCGSFAADPPQGTTMRATNGIGYGVTTIAGRLLSTNVSGTNHFAGTINSRSNISSQAIFYGNGGGLTNLPTVTIPSDGDFLPAYTPGTIVSNYPYQAWPVLFAAPDTNLIYVTFSAGDAHTPLSNSIIMMSTSTNSGNQWSANSTIVTNPGKAVLIAATGVDAQGRLYSASPSADFGSSVYTNMFIRISDDHGATWTVLTNLPCPDPVYIYPHGHIFEQDDYIFFAAYGDGNRSYCYRSPDRGTNWAIFNMPTNPITSSEVCMVGFGRGTLYAAKRLDVANPRQSFFASTNNGVTWTTNGTAHFNMTALQGNPVDMLVNDDGDVVLAVCDRILSNLVFYTMPLSMAMTATNWNNTAIVRQRVIATNVVGGYASIIKGTGNTVLCAYYNDVWEYLSPANIHFVSFDSGTLVSGTVPDARLSTNVPMKDAVNIFTKSNSFTGRTFTSYIDVGDLNVTNSLITFGLSPVLNQVGLNNHFIGRQVGNFTLTGVQNIGVGYSSLQALTTGSYNATEGASVMSFATTAHHNDAKGVLSLNGCIDCYNNVTDGAFTLYASISGHDNVAEGFNALFYSTANNNVGIGANAGVNPDNDIARYRITSDDNMTLIGYGATKDSLSILSGSTAIGNRARVTESNQVMIGGTNVTTVVWNGVAHGDGAGITNLPATVSFWNTNPAAASSISNTYNVKTTGSIQSTNTATANTALTLNGGVSGGTGQVLVYRTNSTDKFVVEASGSIAGTKLDIAGTTTAINLKVDDGTGYGIYVSGQNSLNFNFGQNADTAGYINLFGYNNGVTQFRDLVIGNGKAGIMAYFDGSTGNVGIGVPAPMARLDLKSAGTSISSLEILAQLYKSSTGGGGILLRSHDTRADISSFWNTAATALDLTFSTINSAGVYIEAMRIQNSTTNVGIGTVSPVLTLDVAGAIKTSEYLYATNTSRTNEIHGKIEGDGGIATGAGGVALGLNNQSASYGFVTGIGNKSFSSFTIVAGRSNLVSSGADGSIVGGSFNEVQGSTNQFVSGTANEVGGNNSAAIGRGNIFDNTADNCIALGQNIAFSSFTSTNNFAWSDPSGLTVTRSNSFNVNATGGSFFTGGPISGSGAGLTAIPPAAVGIRHGISGAMVLGSVTVTDSGCTANTRYFFSAHTLGTISIPGGYYASTRNVGTSFVITSSQATETSTIDWMALEP